MRLSCEAGMRGEGAESAYWGVLRGRGAGAGGGRGAGWEGAWSGEIRETRAVEGEE